MAVEGAHIDTVKYLVHQGAHINSKDYNGVNTWHCICMTAIVANWPISWPYLFAELIFHILLVCHISLPRSSSMSDQNYVYTHGSYVWAHNNITLDTCHTTFLIICYTKFVNHINILPLSICLHVLFRELPCTLQLKKAKGVQWNSLLIAELTLSSKIMLG